VFIRRPSDLGYPDGGWQLPPLTIRDEVVITGLDGELGGIGGARRSGARRSSRPGSAGAEIIRASGDQWLVWCGLNDEEDAIAKALGADCVEQVSGSDGRGDRDHREREWRDRQGPRARSAKPKVFGFGLNWQHCNRMLFLGLGDSYEQYYQAVRRCWRFGQTQPVEAWSSSPTSRAPSPRTSARKEAGGDQHRGVDRRSGARRADRKGPGAP
jgi:hypothetical protein